MSLPPGFLDELRDRVLISSVVGRKVTWDMRKSNQAKGDFWAPCPFHQEKSASFHVDDRKGFYYCFGCHAKGDTLKFLQETENIGFMDAVALLARERWPGTAPALLGISMDAPLLDPGAVVTRRVRRVGLPRLAARLGLALAARRTGVDFASLDLLRFAPMLDVPVLVQMTAEDGTIPVDLVAAFAACAPRRWLDYRRLERGDHVESWNVDPEGYESALSAFLERALRL